jgi:hypothetical protein
MGDKSLPLQQNLHLPSAPRVRIYNWQTAEYEEEAEVDRQPASPSSSHPPSNSASPSLESAFDGSQEPDFPADVPDVVEGGLCQEQLI